MTVRGVQPRLSVCVPTYNYARYLAEAIESILCQSYTDFELLIRDDCSSDETVEVVSAFARRDPRIRFDVNSPNLGMVQNWNRCLAEAKGSYIKYVFADDFLVDQDALARMVQVLDANPRVSLVTSARRIVDADSRSIGLWSHFDPEGEMNGGEVIARCLREDVNFIGEPSATMFRKAQGINGFDESFCQLVDLEMWFRLLQEGSLFFIAAPLCAFRVHSAQQTEVNRRAGMHILEMLRLAVTFRGAASVKGSAWEKWIDVCRLRYKIFKAFRRGSITWPQMVSAQGGGQGLVRFAATLPPYWLYRTGGRACHSIQKRWNHR